METIYPGAKWRPLSAASAPGIGVPRVLIFHTMVGYLAGTDSMFRVGGYSGTESQFGVGGVNDGVNDGVIWQWEHISQMADAQFDGNRYATSVETSDGGHPERPWSPKQLAALVNLSYWWCRQTGHPAVMVTSTSGAGFGYHSQFPAWNRSAHGCPGPVRVAQLRNTLIPAVAARLRPPVVKPPTKPPVYASYVLRRYIRLASPYLTGDDVRHVQALVGCATDGAYGPASVEHVRVWQRAHSVAADGIVGPATAKAAGWAWQP